MDTQTVHDVPAPPHRRRTWMVVAVAAAVILVIVAAVVTVVLLRSGDDDGGTAPGASPSAPVSPSVSPPPSPSPQPSASPTAPVTPVFRFQPLWPFAGVADAAAWQASYRSGGHQPWHLDPALTALSFTREYLGYRDGRPDRQHPVRRY